MSLSTLSVGRLLWWENYPLQRDNEEKDRVFIYLGRMDPFFGSTHYLVTGTSKIAYYTPKGSRAQANNLFLHAGSYSCLSVDTVFDVDLNLCDPDHLTLVERQKDLIFYDTLNNEHLYLLFDSIAQSPEISYTRKMNIKTSFVNYGLTNLPAVERRTPKYRR